MLIIFMSLALHVSYIFSWWGTTISEGPRAMLQGALLYGGMIYVFSGAGRRKNLPPEEYTEVEF